MKDEIRRIVEQALVGLENRQEGRNRLRQREAISSRERNRDNWRLKKWAFSGNDESEAPPE